MVDIVTPDGEVVPEETVEFSYTREGRKTIGKEYPNPIPMELPLGQEPHEPVWEMIRRMVLDHAKRQKEQEEGEEFDSEEEANDFNVGDDFDPSSPFEEVHEPTMPWPMSRAAAELEAAINEKRNGRRIDALKEELKALEEGKEWPPQEQVSPPTLTVKNKSGNVVGTVEGSPGE